MKIQDLQKTLLQYFQTNSKTARLLQYAEMFVYIYLGLLIIGLLPLPNFIGRLFSSVTAVCYYLFIIGGVMTFAKNKYLPVVAVYGVKCLDRLIAVLRYSFYLPTFVNFILYGVVTYALVRLYFYTAGTVSVPRQNMYGGGAPRTNAATYTNPVQNTNFAPNQNAAHTEQQSAPKTETASQAVFCANCGTPAKPQDMFCERCGQKIIR